MNTFVSSIMFFFWWWTWSIVQKKEDILSNDELKNINKFDVGPHNGIEGVTTSLRNIWDENADTTVLL